MNAFLSQMDDRVLAWLQAHPAWTSPKKVAEGVAEDRKAKASEVNPSLYRLLKQAKVEKRAEADGTSPEWRATGALGEVAKLLPTKSEVATTAAKGEPSTTAKGEPLTTAKGVYRSRDEVDDEDE